MNKKFILILLLIVLLLIANGCKEAQDFAGKAVKQVKGVPAYDINKCYDSDGGNKVKVEGATIGKFGGVSSTKKDSCNSIGKLIEYYCRNNNIEKVVTSCPMGFICSSGKCALPPENLLFDGDGRLTDYALSFAPPMLNLNLNQLPKLHPENYGNNYFEPGTYTVKVGDGIGKGDFLIKFVDVNVCTNDCSSSLFFEVFKKEKDGNYYHYPTNDNKFIESEAKDFFGMVLKLQKFNNVNNIQLTYLDSCSYFIEQCEYTNGLCYICYFDEKPGEIKLQSNNFTAIFPEEYPELASLNLEELKKCYNYQTSFLGFDPKKLRIGLNIKLSEINFASTSHDESISIPKSKEMLDSINSQLPYIQNLYNSVDCASDYFPLSHELSHTIRKELFTNKWIYGNNAGFEEGLSNFQEFAGDDNLEGSYCASNGFLDDSGILPYASLSVNSGDSLYKDTYGMGGYYITGFCFWQDFVHTYGYPQFVLLMQTLYTKSRGINDYNVVDVMENVIGEPLSQELMTKYQITKNAEANVVDICHNCEMFIS